MNEITIRFIEVYKYLLETKKVSNPSHFAKTIGVSTSMMNEILKERSNAGINPIQNTVKVFTEISSDWLLTGRGKILNKDSDTDIISQNHTENEKEIERLKDKIADLQTINELLTRTVKLIDKKNSNVVYLEPNEDEYNQVAEPAPEIIKKPKR